MGRDSINVMNCLRRCSFNPRARVGRDKAGEETVGGAYKFQSTRPRGARLSSASPDFNSSSVSIHAPAWGATELDRKALAEHMVSIHAPAWGATLKRIKDFAAQPVSIHAPAWGATQLEPFQRYTLMVSIHAPAWGAT